MLFSLSLSLSPPNQSHHVMEPHKSTCFLLIAYFSPVPLPFLVPVSCLSLASSVPEKNKPCWDDGYQIDPNYLFCDFSTLVVRKIFPFICTKHGLKLA